MSSDIRKRLAIVLTVIGVCALISFWVEPKREERSLHEEKPNTPVQPIVTMQPVLPKPERRFAVAAHAGHFVVVFPDGSSHLEGPDGKKLKQLSTKSQSVASETMEKLVKQLNTVTSANRPGIEQLIVCDKGIVSVPKDSVITLIGEDRVVTHSPDGASTTYHVDGRVNRRGVADRPLGVGAKKTGK